MGNRALAPILGHVPVHHDRAHIMLARKLASEPVGPGLRPHENERELDYHDLGVVATVADHVLVLERGKVCEEGRSQKC